MSASTRDKESPPIETQDDCFELTKMYMRRKIANFSRAPCLRRPKLLQVGVWWRRLQKQKLFSQSDFDIITVRFSAIEGFWSGRPYVLNARRLFWDVVNISLERAIAEKRPTRRKTMSSNYLGVDEKDVHVVKDTVHIVKNQCPTRQKMLRSVDIFIFSDRARCYVHLQP